MPEIIPQRAPIVPAEQEICILEDETIYAARYASVDVYETTIRGHTIMKNCSNGNVNASHILKLAKVPKTKRLKIIKKLCALVPFEEVRIGFHTFQGYWVPLVAARRLAKQWKVDVELDNLFQVNDEWKLGTRPEVIIKEKTVAL